MAAEVMPVKQPREVLDYDFNFATWLPTGDTLDAILDTAVTVTSGDDVPADTLVIDSTVLSTTAVKVWLSAGVDRVKYKITCLVHTTNGRTKEGEMIIPVKDE